MDSKVANGKTSEERQAEAQSLHDGIVEQVEALTEGDRWEAFLRMATGFHQFSLSNLLLILRQCPAATRVAGYRQWQARGRQVKRGERGIKIFGYASKRIEPENEADEERRATYFPILTVFDVSQTEPMDGAAEVPDLAPRLIGGDDAGIFGATVAWLAELGWSVERQHLAAADGVTSFDGSRRVLIHDELEPAHEALTVLHESAHVLLHAEVTAYHQHRGIYETEAESAAFVVAGVLGLDTSANSVGYVAAWTRGDVAIVKATAEHVLTTVRTILDGITEGSD